MSVATVQRISLVVGVVYLVIGILGFLPGITVPTPGPLPSTGLLLGIFAVNAVHNLVHVLVGAVLVWASRAPGSVRRVNQGLAVVFALLVVASFAAPVAEGIAINVPDTLLHLVSLLLTGYLGFLSARGGARS